MTISIQSLRSRFGRVETFTVGDREYVAFVPNSLTSTTPVLITHDAQNYLVDLDSTWNGENWGVTEAIDAGRIRAHDFNGLPLIVSVSLKDSAGLRFNELAPQEYMETRSELWLATVALKKAVSSQLMGNAYIDEIVSSLLPRLADRYGIELSTELTAIAGSSMGGVASLYAVGRHPGVFGAALAYSTHWVVGQEDLVPYLLDRIPLDGSHLIWTDRGDLDLDATYAAGHAQAQQRLEQLGWKLDENFIAAVFYGTGHAEKFWSRRIELPINWWLSKIS